MGFLIITDRGRNYLDRMFRANYKIGDKSDRKQRVLTMIEHNQRITDQEILAHVSRQRSQISSRDIGWASPGTKQDYLRTIKELEREGMIRRD